MKGIGIKITGIEISGYSVSVPDGLSELINRHNGWSKEKGIENLNGYTRKVYFSEGKLVTELTSQKYFKQKSA